MAQLEHIEAIEKRLWSAADGLRANSNLASNEYFMPVMGLVFLRHAYGRYLLERDAVMAKLPSRGGKKREVTKEDFSDKGAIFLRPEAQYDYLSSLPDGEKRAQKIIDAMESIEADYETLKGVLPKEEYREIDNATLGELLVKLDPEELKHMSGDVFGRIYEYFLTQFAGQKAHDGGEFFTPISIVSFIANVLEPTKGAVLDPICGPGRRSLPMCAAAAARRTETSRVVPRSGRMCRHGRRRRRAVPIASGGRWRSNSSSLMAGSHRRSSLPSRFPIATGPEFRRKRQSLGLKTVIL